MGPGEVEHVLRKIAERYRSERLLIWIVGGGPGTPNGRFWNGLPRPTRISHSERYGR